MIVAGLLWLRILSQTETFPAPPDCFVRCIVKRATVPMTITLTDVRQVLASDRPHIDISNNRTILARTNTLTRRKWNCELSLTFTVLQQV
jgi:hypothetical protein